MPAPLAAHTFDFFRLYLSSRDSSPPGSGVWSNPVKIFDGVSALGQPDSVFAQANTFSAGALNSTDPKGIVVHSQAHLTDGLAFLGDGLPTLPQLITYPGMVAGTSASSDYWDISQGAWNTSAGFFALVENNFDTVEMVFSSDNGATWAIQDGSSAFHPPTTSATTRQGQIQRVDSRVYCFFATSTAFTSFKIYIFNLTTKLWESPIAPLTSSTIFDFGPNRFSNDLYRFPNGDFGVLYDNSNQVAYRLFTAATSSWGAEIPLGTGIASGLAVTLIDPSQQLIHVFSYAGAGARGGAVGYSTVTHAGVVTSLITTILAPSGGSIDGVNHPSIQNGMLFVPRDDLADFDNAVWVASLPVTTFLKEELPIPPGESGFISAVAINAGGTGYALGDTGTINGGVYPQSYSVSGVSGGAVTGITLTENGGGGYSTGTNIATTRGLTQPGSGTGLTVNITAVTGKQPSCAYMMYPNGYQSIAIMLACPTSTAQVGVPYSSRFVVTGGTPPYTFAIIAGMLPPGLTLDTTTGVVSGTPTTPGNYTYTGQVTDANGLMATATCTISIPVPLSASCPSQSSIAIGVPYSGTITVTGGTPPYTFALTGGALPPGLTLNTSTGVISGTPTAAGTFNYQVTITDSVGNTFVLNCSFGISSCPSFTLIQECSPIR